MTLTKRPTPEYPNIPLYTESLKILYFVRITYKAAPELILYY